LHSCTFPMPLYFNFEHHFHRLIALRDIRYFCCAIYAISHFSHTTLPYTTHCMGHIHSDGFLHTVCVRIWRIFPHYPAFTYTPHTTLYYRTILHFRCAIICTTYSMYTTPHLSTLHCCSYPLPYCIATHLTRRTTRLYVRMPVRTTHLFGLAYLGRPPATTAFYFIHIFCAITCSPFTCTPPCRY